MHDARWIDARCGRSPRYEHAHPILILATERETVEERAEKGTVSDPDRDDWAESAERIKDPVAC